MFTAGTDGVIRLWDAAAAMPSADGASAHSGGSGGGGGGGSLRPLRQLVESESEISAMLYVERRGTLVTVRSLEPGTYLSHLFMSSAAAHS